MTPHVSASPHPTLSPTSSADVVTYVAQVSSNGFDLTGYSTLALAVVTVALAVAAFRQAYLSRKGIDATRTETERAFKFEALREMQTMVPIVIAEASPKKAGDFRYLSLRNVGLGPALNVRFSGTLNGDEFSAAQYSVSAIAASGGITHTRLRLHKDYDQRWPLYELLIRYEDVFGNTYSTEYSKFQDDSEWYKWRQPWLGRDLGVAKPVSCSDDEPDFGLKGRVYYDATQGLY